MPTRQHIVHDPRLQSENNPAAVLKNEQVYQIRELLAAGVTQTQLAKQYGCSVSTISKIRRGQNWAFLPPRPVAERVTTAQFSGGDQAWVDGRLEHVVDADPDPNGA